MPKAHIVAVLLNPTSPEAETQRRDVTTAAHAIGRQLIVLNAANENAIDAAFATIVEQRVEALLVGSDPYFLARRTQILALPDSQLMALFEYAICSASGLTDEPSTHRAWRRGGLAVAIVKGVLVDEPENVKPFIVRTHH